MKDINILGMGNIVEGEYDTVKISGSSTIMGKTKMKELKVAGSVKVTDVLEAETVKISGAVTFEKELIVDHLSVAGACSAMGNIKAQTVKISGSFKTPKEVQAEEVKISGKCKIDSMNVGTLLIRGAKYEIRELHADIVEINPEDIKLRSFLLKTNSRIELCECTQISAYNLNCGRLYIKSGKIGPKCVIDYLEYTDMVDIHVDATVKELVKAELSK